MQDLNITTETIPSTITVHHWNCPDCGCKCDTDNYAPTSRRDALCQACSDALCEREFQACYAPVIDARVKVIEQPDVTYDREYVKRIVLRATDGCAWEITSHDVLYLRILEEADDSQ